MPFETTTLERNPVLAEQVGRLAGEVCPTFMLHADTPYWSSLFNAFAGFQILFCDPADNLIALGHTIPFVWDGTLENLPSTIDEVMERAIDTHRERRSPTALSALAALVSPEHQGRGLSPEVLQAMRSLATEHGMHSLVAPVCPTFKSLYPLPPIEAGVITGKTRSGAPSGDESSRVPSFGPRPPSLGTGKGRGTSRTGRECILRCIFRAIHTQVVLFVSKTDTI